MGIIAVPIAPPINAPIVSKATFSIGSPSNNPIAAVIIPPTQGTLPAHVLTPAFRAAAPGPPSNAVRGLALLPNI